MKSIRALLLIISLLLAICISLSACNRSEVPPGDTPVHLVKDGTTNYKIVYSSADNKGGTMAYALNQAIARSTGGVTLEAVSDTVPETRYELLLGDTSRQLTKDLKSYLAEKTNEESHLWGFAFEGGQFAFYYNTKIAFDLGLEEFKSEFLKDNCFTVYDGTVKTSYMTFTAYDEMLAGQEAAEKAARLETIKAEISAFDDTLFGERKPMPTGLYLKPETYPKSGQHPRLLVSSDMIPRIKEVLENPTYATLSTGFWNYANLDTDGRLNKVSAGTTNFDEEVLRAIEAKAMAYLLTGDEIYGYGAILAAKNFLLTVSVTHDQGSDIFLYYSRSMQVMGEVYDWCYGLLTENDKSQIVRGVQKYLCEDCSCGKTDKITIGFPPTEMNGVNGHGTNCMLQRDYLSFALAIYDEYPDWWELVAGRYYEEFVPASDVFFEAGAATQGTNNYIWNKLHAQLCAAWIIKVATGSNPYDSGLRDVANFVMHMRLPNGNLFSGGDGSATATGSSDRIGEIIYILAALYPSEINQINANVLTNYYTAYRPTERTSSATPTTYLIYRANGLSYDPESTDINKGLESVRYTEAPMSQMTARSSWSDDAAVVLMKIGELSGGNHDHQDFGTFQIYYKGCLSGESGQYGTGAGYGTAHWKMWSQSTISHNGLLIYNPDFSDSDPVFAEDGSVTNDSRYYYSGSQRVPSTGTNVNTWLSGGATMGRTTGVAYGYKAASKSLDYAYLAGDITQAYSQETVDAVERRMLSVYTDSEDYPMFFIVYDYIKSTDENYKKSFLFHTVTEPTVEGNVATYVQNDGKMVLVTLTDDAVMTKYGGENKTYWINDEVGNLNIAEEAGGTGASKGDSDTISDGALWGRVQIDNTGKLEDHLLNVIYVTDATNEALITPKKIETDTFVGMQLEGVVAVFNKGISKNRSALELVTEGEGNMSYYISGLSAGTWRVLSGGNVIAELKTTDESGLISFTAPAGSITIEPGNDVRPENSDDIAFITNGATLPEDTQLFYVHDVEYILPVLPSSEDSVFAGWFIYNGDGEKLTAIPAGTRGAIKLYAKFYRLYNEDYETYKVHVEGAKTKVNFIRYVGENKTSSSFTTVTDPVTGNSYLRWQCGEKDPEIDIKESLSDFLVDGTSVTFGIDIALDGDNPAIKTTFRLRGDHSSKSSTVFCTTSDGYVTLGGSADHTVGKLTKEFQRFIFTVDFKEAKIYAFDTDGNVIDEKELILPLAFTSTVENATAIDYLNALIFIFDWYSGKQTSTDTALRIDNITIFGGYPSNSKK